VLGSALYDVCAGVFGGGIVLGRLTYGLFEGRAAQQDCALRPDRKGTAELGHELTDLTRSPKVNGKKLVFGPALWLMVALSLCFWAMIVGLGALVFR
jgi:hypothetical protein